MNYKEKKVLPAVFVVDSTKEFGAMYYRTKLSILLSY